MQQPVFDADDVEVKVILTSVVVVDSKTYNDIVICHCKISSFTSTN